MTVEEFLREARAREPSIKKSIGIWMARNYPKGRVERKHAFVRDIAPDGREYLDGSIPKWRQPAARGKQ